MLSYQHAYHAGNFADVHKHLGVFAVTEYLQRKPAAMTLIDTHAGRGVYPLAAEETRRLGEYRHGVLPVWEAHQGVAGTGSLLDLWCSALSDFQPVAGTLSHYPGSPWWMERGLRDQDALLLFELHPGEHAYLTCQDSLRQQQRIRGDGLDGLCSRLPVATPRLCVLIDPSYERKDEYLEVAEAVLSAMAKARHAVIMIWYPLLEAGHHERLVNALAGAELPTLWQSEFHLRAPDEAARGMYGSGVLFINPPWGLDTRLSAALETVAELSRAATGWRAGVVNQWLIGS